MTRPRLSRWHAAVGALVSVAAVFTVTMGTASAATHQQQQSCSINNPCIHGAGSGDVDKGSTAGWFAGQTVHFEYSKNFYCAAPPSSAAKTFCEGGAQARFAPVAGQIDPLYVVVPIGFTPTSGLQCPNTGACVDHPHTIDLSRIFGSAASNALLPPHSHVVTTRANGVAEWWRIFVVGVTTQGAFDGIVHGKSFDAVRDCQTSKACTPSIASNLFLYFAVR